MELSDENEIRFPLDMRRAVAMENKLDAYFTFEGVNRKGESDRRDEKAQTNFIARPPDRDWRDYRIVMWQQYPVEQWNTLKSLRLTAPEESYVYDIRKGAFLGKRKEMELTLDAYVPAIFAFLPAGVEGIHLATSRSVPRGSMAEISFAVDSPAATGVFHVDIDPAGTALAYYSDNFFGVEGRGGMQVPFAVNENPLTWEVRVRELLTGNTARSAIEVR